MGRSLWVWAGALSATVILGRPVLADTKAGVDAWSQGDFAGAVREWQGEAAKGDADAFYNLGQAYRLGKGVPQDLRKAEEMYGRAAGLGHLQAADNYGLLMFQRGDQARAIPYIQAAAGRGDPRAQYLLGIACFNGTLIAKDWVRAYALVSLAQQQGIAPATTALKQMDGFIPLEQRQQAAQLAIELNGQADAARARQLAAADLGAKVPAIAPVRPAVPAAAVPPTTQVAANDSPANAGADYARPAIKTPPAAASLIAAAPAKPMAAAAKPAATVALAPGPSGPWRVQLGAFGIAANADAQWARVKGRPELAGHPRIDVRAGAVTKLQAGGFASQAAARATCDRLAASETSCIATSN